MFKLIVGIIGAFLAITFLASFMLPITEMIGISRGSNSLNCPGFVDDDEGGSTGVPGNTTYNPDIESPYTAACTTIVMLPLILVAGVLLSILMYMMYPSESAPQPLPYR